MRIYTVKERTAKLRKSLIEIWENSVRATHTFLTDEEINAIKAYVPQVIENVENLIVAEIENENDKDNKIVAFVGVENRKIEMLFVDNDKRGRGIGKKLVEYAIEKFSAETVTVNEQNPQAVGFYEYMGFETYKRTDLDEQGNPYPILYMKLRDKYPAR